MNACCGVRDLGTTLEVYELTAAVILFQAADPPYNDSAPFAADNGPGGCVGRAAVDSTVAVRCGLIRSGPLPMPASPTTLRSPHFFFVVSTGGMNSAIFF
jgi:hypothetical protein